jgi:hypothetical protein
MANTLMRASAFAGRSPMAARMTRGLAVQSGAKTWAVSPSAFKVGRAHFSSDKWPNRATKPIGIGETIPAGAMVDDLVLEGGFDPAKKCFKEICAGKTVLVIGQPGAFTPC